MSTTTTWPGGATSASPTAYTVPAAGELNWAALSDFLNALASGAQSTTFQKFAVRKAVASPVTVSATTDCVVASNLTVPGAVTVNLPAGQNKLIFCILDDKGDAGTNNITINRNGSDTIAGSTSLVLTTAREYVMLCYNSSDTDWKIIARGAGTGAPLNNPMDSAGDMIYGGTGGSAQKLDSGTAETWLISKGAASPSWSNTVATGKFFDGGADEIQARIQANGTQTADIWTVEKSDSTIWASVSGDGFPVLNKGFQSTDTQSVNRTVASGKTQFHPFLTIDTGCTYTIDAGGHLAVIGTLTVTGSLVINGSVVVS